MIAVEFLLTMYFQLFKCKQKNFDIDLHAIGLEYELTEDLVSTSVATN